jgi:DNA invertase Pin-like site-specific DNA recombinase
LTYILIGPGEPTPATQRAELASLIARRGCEHIREYQDKNYAAEPARRPGVRSLLAHARNGSIEAIAVWRLSFLFWDVRHLVRDLSSLLEQEIRFVSLREGIDTGGSTGEGFARLVKSLAQLEKDVRSEKIRIGLAQAAQAGTRIGRPSKALDTGRIRELRIGGASIRRIAKETGVSKSRIALVLRQPIPAGMDGQRNDSGSKAQAPLEGPQNAT